jgi:hypothetical protein
MFHFSRIRTQDRPRSANLWSSCVGSHAASPRFLKRPRSRILHRLLATYNRLSHNAGQIVHVEI